MAKPRKEQISLSDTPYYHIVSSCVRRSFLCGFDNETQQSYEHRKQWIVDRIRLLSSLFAIDLCSYAIMSNHYHLVVKIDRSQPESWSNREVAKRWTAIYRGSLLLQQWLNGAIVDKTELTTVEATIEVWRKRLCNISWFMKCLNEPIARKANKEDGCTGHFWESRFKSQALLDDAALLSCMVYVELNPIRAGIRQTPESSDYTSIQERIKPKWTLNDVKQDKREGHAIRTEALTIKPLSPFNDQCHSKEIDPLPYAFIDYLELVDWTGRIVREDKRGFIPESIPPITIRLGIEQDQWINQSTQFENNYRKKRNRKRRIDSG